MVVDGGEVHRGDDLHEQDEASQGAQHHIRLRLTEKQISYKGTGSVADPDPVTFSPQRGNS